LHHAQPVTSRPKEEHLEIPVSNLRHSGENQQCYLRLEEATLQQNQSLPFVFVYQFTKTHTEILVSVYLVIENAFGFLICQTLLESAENLNIGKLTLRKPSLRDNTQTLTKHAEELRAIGNDHNSLLDSGSRNIGRAIDELR
jgi:hypothetical protein